MSNCISIVVEPPGPRPKKPAKPKKPQATFKRCEEVWSSENENVTFSQLLLLIPPEVRADDIHLRVSRNETNGYPYASISYECAVVNLQFDKQMIEYGLRLKKYETDLIRWTMENEIWQMHNQAYIASIQELHNEISQAFIEVDAI